LIIIICYACLLIGYGCKSNGSAIFCTPCNDFKPPCINKKIDCPICSSIDDLTGALTVLYDNGDYYISNGDTTVFYNSDGTVCYSVVPDPSTGMITYTLNGAVYTELNGAWTCPDNSSWQELDLCSSSFTSVLPGTDNYTNGATGCNLVDLPGCQTPPQF
jgi:hypothetical protein